MSVDFWLAFWCTALCLEKKAVPSSLCDQGAAWLANPDEARPIVCNLYPSSLQLVKFVEMDGGGGGDAPISAALSNHQMALPLGLSTQLCLFC
jgi:hypothetical protein